jgi:Hemolysin activation/secretion protein
VVLLVASSPTAAAAQRPPELPTQVLPDVRLQDLPPTERPRQAPELSVPQSAPTRAPAGADQIRFVLNGIELDGVTAYPPDALRSFYADLIGQEVSLGDIYRVADEIQRKYREDGYFLARTIVPAQTVREGVFRLQVIEGYVNRIEVEGQVGAVEDLAKQYLDQVTEERPLKLATLERALLLTNDIPGVSARGVLRPATGELGAAELVVTIDRTPFNGLVNLDNYGTKYTGLTELAGAASANSFTQAGEQLSLTGLVSDPFNGFNQNYQQWVAQASGSARFGAGGLFAEGLFSYGQSRPGFLVRQLDLDSTTLLGSVDVGYPIIRSRDLSLYARFGFDYIDSDTDIFDTVSFSRDRLRVLFLKANADFADAWRGANSVSAGLRQGLPIFDATQSSDQDTSRPGAGGQETVLTASASRLQPLFGSFELAGFPASVALSTSAVAQYAFDPLLAYEEFELGGVQYGRGYDLGELSGDSGVGVSGELQLNHRPEFADVPFFDGYQLFGFFDYGRVWNHNGGPDNDLASAGAGIRTSLFSKLSVEVIGAKPLLLKTERADFSYDPQLLFRIVGRL